jgi:hypothetical protein
MKANKPMTGEQLDELMTVAVNFQRGSEKTGERAFATFAYAVQVAVLELRKVRDALAVLAAENSAQKNAMRVTLEHVSVMDTGQAGVAAMIINDALHNSETPATAAFLAEVRASGVDMFALMYAEEAIKSDSISIGWRARASKAAFEYADQIRQGGAA